jgi:hypothetical protein
MAAVMIGMLPVLGAPWVGILYMLAALVLVTVRRPWSFLLYGVACRSPRSRPTPSWSSEGLALDPTLYDKCH